MFAGVDADAFDFTALFLSGVFGILIADIFFVRSIVLLSEEISQDACCHLRAHCTLDISANYFCPNVVAKRSFIFFMIG